MSHEAVANHYYISSINLAEEVAQRIRDGEFDWKEFGGTHPAWRGHRYYAAAINRLFDLEWGARVAGAAVRAHEVPEKPIDRYSYDKGAFVDIRSAKQLNGWRVVEDWTPKVKGNTRKGFVNVPMLVTDRAGAVFRSLSKVVRWASFVRPVRRLVYWSIVWMGCRSRVWIHLRVGAGICIFLGCICWRRNLRPVAIRCACV